MFPGFQHFPEGQIIAFALIFLRIVAFVFAWPVFGVQTVPVPVKILLTIVFCVVLFPIVKFQNVNLISINDSLIFLSVREVFVGLFMGFLLRFFFFSVSIAGEIVGVTSGLASAQLFNPAMGGSTNVFEQVHIVMATLFLLAINGHHMFIQGLAQSFDLIPIADVGVKYTGFTSLSAAAGEAFFMGIKMAAPVLATVFLTNVTMGVLGRAVPQLNVMTTGFQITILITFIVVILAMPLFVDEMGGLMQIMTERFFSGLKVI
jgi:flagellar biosynthesis protein FliR